jgi:hypothetical protein
MSVAISSVPAETVLPYRECTLSALSVLDMSMKRLQLHMCMLT